MTVRMSVLPDVVSSRKKRKMKLLRKKMEVFTRTKLLTAQKCCFIFAPVVKPFQIFSMISQTILTVKVIWLVLLPKCELERTASVRPLPIPLLFQVRASNPEEWDASVRPLPHDVVVGGVGGDRRQVSSLLLAEVFSSPPTLLLRAPEVAEAPILLPVLFASFHTLALVAS